MLNTKVSVDKYIQSHVKKFNSEKERNQFGYRFAKLYYSCGEYEMAKRYTAAYLTVVPESAVGHRLLAEALEQLNQRDAALQSYRRSLELDVSQKDLLLKVCELMAADDVCLDPSTANHWCEQAQVHFPNHPTLFTLRERMLTAKKDTNSTDVENLILSELEQCPTDVGLRIRLLQHLIRTNKISEAYKHAIDVEQLKYNIFAENLPWYETVAQVLVRFQRDNSNTELLNYEFWIFVTAVSDKVISLSLDEQSAKSVPQCAAALFDFDQKLYLAVDCLKKCSERNLVQEFVTHYNGQLCLHIATLIFKKAKIDKVSFKEACRMNIPLLLGAWSAHPADITAGWTNQCDEKIRKWIKRWNLEANFRSSQAGYSLLAILGERRSNFADKLTQICSGNWRERLFKMLFVNREQTSKIKSSYFMTCQRLAELRAVMPSLAELATYDETAQLLHPASLHHFVWIALNRKLSEVTCAAFGGLQYSVTNLSNCSVETLNLLDIQSFVYCATLCARERCVEARHASYTSADKPHVLPVCITDHMCTPAQDNWFRSAYKVYKNQCGADLGSLRLILTHGIETVRCVANHGLHVNLLVQLANTLSAHEKQVTDPSQKEYVAARATLFWNNAIPLLKRLKNNQVITYAANKKPLFDFRCKEMTAVEINNHLEDGKLYLACQLKDQKEHERALEMFRTLKSPYASFYQGLIYKTLAGEQIEESRENVTSEMRSQHIILLSKARDCFYLTLDRLREPSVDRKHPLNAELGTAIENIDSLLSRIDPDMCLNQNECDNNSDENLSSAGSMGDHIQVASTFGISNYANGNATPRHRSRNLHSTPYRNVPELDSVRRTEARPSPERLEAQIRQMAATKDAMVTHILDQFRMMLDSHRGLSDEIRGLKDAITNLTRYIEEFKTLKMTVDNFTQKTQDDLNTIKEFVDQIPIIKKEIIELKKDTSKLKNTQLNDDDLYVLDDDYDFNINVAAAAASTAFNQSPLYPGFTGRAPLSYPPAMYPNMYAPPVYGYPGLPTTLAFGDTQMPDLRGIGPLAQSSLTPQAGVPLIQHGLGSLPPQNANANPTLNIPQLPLQLPHSTAGSVFTKPQSEIRELLLSSQSNALVNKAPPVNVVITASDPVPTTVTTQPILSVTIPPQHLKGNLPKAQPQPPTHVHNYQIQLPETLPNFTSTIGATKNTAAPMPVTTQSLLSNIALPLYSSISEPKNTSLSKQNVFTSQPDNSSLFTTSTIFGTPNTSLKTLFGTPLSVTPNVSQTSIDLNKTGVSISSLDEHDPCPDFKPIIPLPDEVEVRTGEEGETVLYKERAKLYRLVDREWKERGVGDIKLLRNEQAGTVRVLMRRDQVHKICANHFILKDMDLRPQHSSDRAFVWIAKDFADEELREEKLCVRFKTPEQAALFRIAFEKAKELLSNENNSTIPENKIQTLTSTPVTAVLKNVSSPLTDVKTPKTAASTLGGFTFSSTPTFAPKSDDSKVPIKAEQASVIKPSPFASFTFGSKAFGTEPTTISGRPKTPLMEFKPLRRPSADFTDTNIQTELKGINKPNELFSQSPIVSLNTGLELQVGNVSTSAIVSDNTAEEFVPTAEFAPVIPLPDLVDIRTGEEEERVLFCARAKLLRYEASTKEWKERGVGNMKILASGIVRLLMRREQILKVCCNHQILKNMEFKKFMSNEKVVTWAAQDYSENELKSEVFSIRFKTVELADSFLQAIHNIQQKMDSGNFIEDSEQVVESIAKSSTPEAGWGDKFKPKMGSWECTGCYTRHDADVNCCPICATPKDGVSSKSPSNAANVQPKVFSATQSSWCDKFKPQTGSWECKGCYIWNESTISNCKACNTAKDGTVCQKESVLSIKDPGEQQFTFGFPPVTKVSLPTEDTNTLQSSSWGDRFKPQVGSWECKACYISNVSSKDYCIACDSPKNDTIPKKDKGRVLFDPSAPTFTFGISPSASIPTFGLTPSGPPSFGSENTLGKFQFGTPTKVEESEMSNKNENPIDLGTKSTFGFQFNKNTPVFSIATRNDDMSSAESKYTFGSPDKFEFGFTPRSPRKSGGGDDSDENVEDEGDHIYFTPVIPLPDKVEVRTGEEDEDVLYCHRAKLFVYAAGEWKERGLGDIKILRHKHTQKLRVVMRREQVLKICLNHALTNEIDYLHKDEKSWLFSAPDYSDGEINYQQYSIRFKSAEIAQEFKNAVDQARSKLPETGDSPDSSDDDDIEVISEITATPEEQEKAKALQLPPNFYVYLRKEPCPGCVGCNSDTYVFKTPDITKKSEPAPSKSNFSFSNAYSTLSAGTNQSAPKDFKSIFGGSPKSTDTPQEVKLIFGKSEPSSPLIFGASKVPQTGGTPTSLFSSNTSLFGNSPKISETSIMGGNLFSGKPQNNSPSLFGTPKFTISANPSFGSTTIGGILKPPRLITEPVSTDIHTSQTFSFDGANNIFNTPKIIELPSDSNKSETPMLFGNTPNAAGNNESKSTFGGVENKDTFGSTETKSMFGSTENKPTIFGSTENKPTIFGSTESKPTLFGNPNSELLLGSKPIFGNIQDNKQQKDASKPINTFSATPIFGASKTSLFGGVPTGTQVFGGSSLFSTPTSLFSTLSTVPPVSKKEETTISDPILKSNSGVDFQTLANASQDNPTFGITGNNQSFMFEGAGAPVFGSLKKQPTSATKKPSKGNDNNEDGDKEDADTTTEDYDPHYEPIVPLPDKIVVTTGEEDEERIFCERAKLFRYDTNTKEWKERGVGDLKVLYHPERGTYRFILRREQVHKIVLNQLLRSDLQLKQLNSSDRGVCWAGLNYAEDTPVLEELALRFKNSDIAVRFFATVAECQEKLRNASFINSGSVQDDGGYDEDEDDDDDDDEDDEDDDEDEGRLVMCENQCVLSVLQPNGTFKELATGCIQVYYHSDDYCTRIFMTTDEDEIISNVPITSNTHMKIDQDTCTWTGEDEALISIQERTLSAKFDSHEAAAEFFYHYKKGVESAQE